MFPPRFLSHSKRNPSTTANPAGHKGVVEPIGELRVRAHANRLQTTVPLFSTLEAEDLVELSEQFELESFSAGREIVHQGDKASKFYVLLEGTAEVFREGRGSSTVPLAILQNGAFFGEMALLSSKPRTATVRARTECTVLSLSRQHFNQLVERQPHIREFLEVVAAARAHENVQRQVYGWAVSGHHEMARLAEQLRALP